jgi:hypothetical protein
MDTNLYWEIIQVGLRIIVAVIEIIFAFLLVTKKFQKLKAIIGALFAATAALGLVASIAIAILPDKWEDIPQKGMDVVNRSEGYLVVGAKVTNPGILKEMVTSSPTTTTFIMKMTNDGHWAAVVKEIQQEME